MQTDRRHILCCDDYEDSCFMLSALLRKAGYEVTTAEGVEEAKRLLRGGRFDLVILDNRFTDGSGVDLCRWAREQSPQTHVIFYSGATSEADREQGLCAGATAYVFKPEVDELLAAVNGLLRSKEPAASGEVRQAAEGSPSAAPGRT
jgi:DNA-binding response OmpR family regulator